jgi:hypothetical protein
MRARCIVPLHRENSLVRQRGAGGKGKLETRRGTGRKGRGKSLRCGRSRRAIRDAQCSDDGMGSDKWAVRSLGCSIDRGADTCCHDPSAAVGMTSLWNGAGGTSRADRDPCRRRDDRLRTQEDRQECRRRYKRRKRARFIVPLQEGRKKTTGKNAWGTGAGTTTG